MNAKEVLEISLKAGKILLKSNAETFRVEETMTKICEAYNIKAECLVLSSGIFLSCTGHDGDIVTMIKRIKNKSNNFDRLEKVNFFSRQLQTNKLNFEQAMRELKDIENSKKFHPSLMLIASGGLNFVYTLLFKGNYREALVAFVIGIIISFILNKFLSKGFFLFFQYVICSIIVGVISIYTSKIIMGVDEYKIIVGSIMILVPGGYLTNALKDAIYGDIYSGIHKFTEALFIALGVGLGILISTAIF